MLKSQSRHNIISKLNHDNIQEDPVHLIGSSALNKKDSAKVSILAIKDGISDNARTASANAELMAKLRGRPKRNTSVEPNEVDNISAHSVHTHHPNQHILESKDLAENINEFKDDTDGYLNESHDVAMLSKFKGFVLENIQNEKSIPITDLVLPGGNENAVVAPVTGKYSAGSPMRSPSFISLPQPKNKTLLEIANDVKTVDNSQSISQLQSPSSSSKLRGQSSIYLPKPSHLNLLESASKGRSPSFLDKSEKSVGMHSGKSVSTYGGEVDATTSQNLTQPLNPNASTSQRATFIEKLDVAISQFLKLEDKTAATPSKEQLEGLTTKDVFGDSPDQSQLKIRQNAPLRLKSRKSELYSPEKVAQRSNKSTTSTFYAKGDINNTYIGDAPSSTVKKDDLFIGLEALGSSTPLQYHNSMSNVLSSSNGLQVDTKPLSAGKPKKSPTKDKSPKKKTTDKEIGSNEEFIPRHSFVLPSSLFPKKSIKSAGGVSPDSEYNNTNTLQDGSSSLDAGIDVLRRTTSMIVNNVKQNMLPAVLAAANKLHNKSAPIFQRLTASFINPNSNSNRRSTNPNDREQCAANEHDDEDYEDEERESVEDEDGSNADAYELQDEFHVEPNIGFRSSMRSSPVTGIKSNGRIPSPKSKSPQSVPMPNIHIKPNSFHNPYGQLGIHVEDDVSSPNHNKRYDHNHEERHHRAMREATAGQTKDSPIVFSASPSSPASSHYSSSVYSVATNNITQHLEIGGQRVLYTPNSSSHDNRGRTNLHEKSERSLMGVSSYDWDTHAFRSANASTAELIALTAQMNDLLHVNSQDSMEYRQKVAVEALKQKLAKRYAATDEDEFQAQLKAKEEAVRMEKVNHEIMRGYALEMTSW